MFPNILMIKGVHKPVSSETIVTKMAAKVGGLSIILEMFMR